MAKPYTKIIINQLALDMFIGVNDIEKEQKQTVQVSVAIITANNPDWQQDDIEKVLNYDNLVKAIREISQSGHIELIETFAEKIAEICLSETRTLNVTVTVEKPDIYPDIESVAVEISRGRKNAHD